MLPDVTVLIKNKQGDFSASTVTDTNGVFTFKSLKENDKYSFSFSHVGFAAKVLEGYSFKNGKPITLSVQLQVSSGTLGEVVVVGYGTVKKSDLTGVVGSVKAKELMERPAINVE